MSMDLKFEEEQIRPVRSTAESAMVYNRFDPRDKIPTIVRIVMKTRIVKTEKQAKLLVVIVAFLLIALAAFLLIKSGKAPTIVRLQLPQ